MKFVKNIFLGVLICLLAAGIVVWYGWLVMLACGIAYHAGVVGGTLNLVQSCIVWMLLATAFSINQLLPKSKKS